MVTTTYTKNQLEILRGKGFVVDDAGNVTCPFGNDKTTCSPGICFGGAHTLNALGIKFPCEVEIATTPCCN